MHKCIFYIMSCPDRENPHESLGIQESQNRIFHFQIPRNRLNFAP